MSAVPDDLDKLLSDVRKSIDDNRLFLKALADDAADGDGSCESGKEENGESEAFEEL